MQDVREALRSNFGHDDFRPGQEAIIRSVLSGRPTVAILPTGGGKSLCYQLPAMLLEGTTVVASPLLALMKDQVDALTARGIPATFVNSSLGEDERRQRQARIAAGEFRLVYVAPERFRSGSFRNAIARLRVPLFAIDEAHCISSWGHDFRPDYQRLAEGRGHLRAERVLALTATATPEVRKDIVRSLGLDDPQVFVAGFDRPNLFIEVARAAGDVEKVGRIVALVRRGGPGLVYAATRRNVEKVVAALRGNGVDALGYHAGMGDAERSEAQERFLRGEVSVVVATNAFGMGVDKADIRFVAHFDVPRSLEAYYQEIGRAGRDGLPSLSLLLFNYADVMLQKRMIEGSRPKEAAVRAVWEAARVIEVGTAAQAASVCDLHPADAQSALKLLEAAGHVARRGQEFSVLTPDVAEPSVDFELAAIRVAHERQMLDRMVRFCDTAGCRRRNLLRYFGDPDSPWSCAACDCCVGPHAPPPEEVSLDRPRSRRSPRSAPPPAPPADMDEEAFAALRALRTQIARETKVPPYVVFHDATLRELAAALPQDERAFLRVKGAGANRWQRYGERVLAITRKHRRRGSASPEPSDSFSGANILSAHIEADTVSPRSDADAGGGPPSELDAFEASAYADASESLPDGDTFHAPNGDASVQGVDANTMSPALDAAATSAAVDAAFDRAVETEAMDALGNGEPVDEPPVLHDSANLLRDPPVIRDSAATWEASTFGMAEVPIVRDSAAASDGESSSAPEVRESPLAAAPATGPRTRNVAAARVTSRPAARNSAAAALKRDAEVVWQLCARGATLAQIAEQTRLPTADVARRLNDLRRAGRNLDVVHLLGADRVDAIRAAAQGAKGDLAAVRRRLPFTAPLAEINLALNS